MYRQMFTSLKRGNIKGVFSNAKPIFIITLLDLIDHHFRNNAIKWSDETLEHQYLMNFVRYDSNKPTPLWKPFYYLGSEPFYYLHWNENLAIQQLKQPSAKFLRENLAYAKLDDDLWELLQDERNREYLKNCLIDYYLKP